MIRLTVVVVGVRRVSLSFPPAHLTFGSAHECKERAATSIFLYRLGAQMEVNRRVVVIRIISIFFIFFSLLSLLSFTRNYPYSHILPLTATGFYYIIFTSFVSFMGRMGFLFLLFSLLVVEIEILILPSIIIIII